MHSRMSYSSHDFRSIGMTGCVLKKGTRAAFKFPRSTQGSTIGQAVTEEVIWVRQATRGAGASTSHKQRRDRKTTAADDLQSN